MVLAPLTINAAIVELQTSMAVQPLGHLLRVADAFTAKISPRAVRLPRVLPEQGYGLLDADLPAA